MSRCIAQLGALPETVVWVRVITHNVGQPFVDDLWDVIHGDALRRESFSAAQSMQLLRRLTRNLP